MTPWAPKPACRVCRRMGCTDPTHKQRAPSTSPPRAWQERKRRAEFLAAWIAERGPLCLGYSRPPHYVSERELTADHVTPRQYGGESGPLQALCLSCNVARGNATRDRRR